MTNLTPNRRVWVEIKLNKIKSNFNHIAEKVAPLHVMAVLKANAYGLGATAIATALSDTDVYSFGVADVTEALSISRIGKPVHILGGIIDDEIPTIVKMGFIAPISDRQTAIKLSAEAEKQNRIIECHYLIDTGMGRLGILYDESLEVIEKTIQLPGLHCTGIYSHFPQAYDDRDFSINQINKIGNLLNSLEQNNIKFKWVHVANSDGINNVPESYKAPFTMVRTGINLYGVFDLQGAQSVELSPVFTIKARLVAVRTLPEKMTIGYGRTYRTKQPTRVGTVSIGYADGVPLALSNRGTFYLRGKECPILGRISMDYTTIQISHVSELIVGDEVICLGSMIPITEWAKAKETISYEIICSIGNRVERLYL